VLRYWTYLAVVFLVLAFYFIELLRRLTIFTTISTFGLILGTGALVIVLSVMSGFEMDLKQKILGTHAHMMITTPDRPFTEYRDTLARVARVPGVVAATPYLTNEVMLVSPSNFNGVIIKGIDPATIGLVTDLVKNTDVGTLDNLQHPERLRTLGSEGLSGQTLQFDLPPPATKKPSPKEAKQEAPNQPATRKDKPPLPKEAKHDGRDLDNDDEAPPRPVERPRRLLPGVVVGRELARNLRLYLGDDVNVVSPLGGIGPSGPIPKAKPFRVAAIFFSGMYEYDSKYVYMLLPAAQKFLGVGDEVTGLELKLADPEHSEAAIAAVSRALAKDPEHKGYEVEDWKQLNRSLFAALKLEKIAMFIVLCFIILVAAFSIVSNGIMLVMEKGKEVAILKSMGATDGSVLRVFVLLGLFMGLLGTSVGILTGIATCVFLERDGIQLNTDVYYITKLPVNMNTTEIVAVLVASLMLALLATVYPAWTASRLRPVDGLK
jgi:lipoprotein-releasing system permease protein